MAQRPPFRRNDSFGSDASSFYSVRSGSARSADSVSSIWSSSDSDAYVYRIDPYGFDNIGGAVTRYVDDRDSRRQRFAAHILSGPFAQFTKRAKHSSSGARSGRSAGNSRSSSRSSGGSVSPGRGHGGHYHSRPPSVEPQFHQEPFHGEPYPQEPFHQGPFQHHNFQGPPPPPPPPPAPAGFEGGFIQLGGPSGPPPPPDPAWGNGAGYGHGVQVFD
ncbi:hypothetical protein GGS26DRAFT_258545 [Hypomontagnella submonticulosa]|nr:hypothetical protein GGS26DRAFT_258545 [Hypomontagnella submonticulosa]